MFCQGPFCRHVDITTERNGGYGGLGVSSSPLGWTSSPPQDHCSIDEQPPASANNDTRLSILAAFLFKTMPSRFVSGGTVDHPIERDEEWLKAQEELEALKSQKEDSNQQAGGKSLYEVLQQNKGELPRIG